MISKTHTLDLAPAGLHLDVARGTPLQEILFAQGVEFPCGGRGRCRGCRVRVLGGSLSVTGEEERRLTPAELADGWRLACRHEVAGDLRLELAQWGMPILGDASSFVFTPREELGVAVDLGTTTLVAQLVDLRTGNVLAVRSALNAQARHGADVMSRIEFAVQGGQGELTKLIREQIGELIGQLVAPGEAGVSQSTDSQQTHGRDARATWHGRPAHVLESFENRDAPERSDRPLARVVLVGNTVMHHLFCGRSVAPLARHPFESSQLDRCRFAPGELGWQLPAAVVVEFLPCLGGFVGSDILAGIVATGLHESPELAALIDLGTNGEIVVGSRERLLCTSTAAGPAFEGARIAMGMRAAPGAIGEVRVEQGAIVCRTLGGGAPRGLCGSGLVDAVAAGLELGRIAASGRMTAGASLPLAGAVSLSQGDVRELQLAKGAIAAGLQLLAGRLGASLDDIRRVHLAGAFGNYVSRASARRIGLLHFPLERIAAAGNTALHGARRALFEEPAAWEAIRRRVEHVALNEDPRFPDVYAGEMRFPE
jgi:uncharacterized 2Fe-2S/4Fe-4S cluster protein (DUF4445 family)